LRRVTPGEISPLKDLQKVMRGAGGKGVNERVQVYWESDV
jgi:hypothetical protein